jgi:phosphonopyruvate decarboxylase
MMCQNSGLGNAVNPLTSLNVPFRIPTLLITTWRGQPGIADEPQHALMGEITQDLLSLMRIGHAPFPRTPDTLAGAFDHARAEMDRTSLPFAFVMQKADLAEEVLDEPVRGHPGLGGRTDLCEHGKRPARVDILSRLLELAPEGAPVIATTGKTGRELFTLQDRAQHLYQVGSMGCAAPMGLGVALITGRRVIVVDGDGAALMKLGAMATIGAYQPAGLLHIVLDNGVHDSTGGQATVSATVDFAGVATACGYVHAYGCDSVAGFAAAFAQALGQTGPVLLHVRIRPGSMEKLGRPTIAPHEVALRFRDFVCQPD